MTTRLDEGRTHYEGTAGIRDLFEMPDLPHPLIQVGAPSAEPRAVPSRALVPAMLAWMSVVFGVCYVGLPMLSAALGWYEGVLGGILFNLPSFLLATFVAVIAAAAANPKVRTDVRANRDPVISAAAGGLLTWLVVHNLSPFLKHFDQFASMELFAFVFMNVIEMTMIGMMLASFTRSKVAAFGLGVGFQLLVLGTVLGLFAV